MAIELVEYDPSWPEQGARARTELIDALPGLFLNAEHVGSTSVPNVAAKPVIDLMVSVATLDDVTAAREAALQRLGYGRQSTGMPGRLFYRRNADAERPAHNLHVVTAGTWDTRNERLFRDHLRAHPDVAAEYSDLKRHVAGEEDDGTAYTKRKTELIQRVVDRERAARGLPLVPVWED